MTDQPNVAPDRGLSGVELDHDARTDPRHDPDDPDSQMEKLAGGTDPEEGPADRKSAT